MNIKALLAVILLIVFAPSSFSQCIEVEKFRRLLTIEDNHYVGPDGKGTLGCGNRLGCVAIPLNFTSICVDKDAKVLDFTVYIDASISGNDTIGSNYYQIFLAKPRKGFLTEVRYLATVNNDSVELDSNTTLALTQARCHMKFKVSKGDRLYFASVSNFHLMEYDISPLFYKKRRQKVK